MSDALQELLQQPGIWRSNDATPLTHCIPSGFAELDTALPGGGWQDQALTEILHDGNGLGELRLLMPALARLSRSGRWVALIAPPHIPYAPALAAQGMDLSRVLLVHPRRGSDALWAVEQALRSGTCAAVLAWPAQAGNRQLRRLQLAAETGATWGVLFRPGAAAEEHSPAAIRLCLRGDGDGTELQVLKARGGRSGYRLRLDLNRPRTRMLPMTPESHGGRSTPRRRPVHGPSGAPVTLHPMQSRPRNPPQEPPDRPQLPLPLEDTPRRQRRLRLLGGRARPQTS